MYTCQPKIMMNLFNKFFATAFERKATYSEKTTFSTSSKGKENSRTRKTFVESFHGNIHKSKSYVQLCQAGSFYKSMKRLSAINYFFKNPPKTFDQILNMPLESVQTWSQKAWSINPFWQMAFELLSAIVYSETKCSFKNRCCLKKLFLKIF